MEDGQIIELYWQRDEAAIRETEARYGARLLAVTRRILDDREDSAESVNDTYLKAWNSIPPQRPASLGGYLCHIARQTAIDRWRRRTADRRPRTEYVLSLEELAECVSGGEEPERAADARALTEAVESWLAMQEPPVREAFVRRYYFLEPLRDIAARQGGTVSRVKSCLFRARQSLKEYLEKEGLL